ncbi:MAG TPA: hypothetical protein PLY82_13705 [Methanosarcina thermophila]|nr:hypothetical protein [Methanosarcina thermophila]
MWRFRKIEPGIPERNPREGEFFRLTEPDEAVVREFIQNALDARSDQIVRIRIYLGEAGRQEIDTHLSTLTPHLHASGFKYGTEKVHFLTIEDYGTTGLDGDIERSDSNFYNFWWREGVSAKSGRLGGRWGLGKTTFHLVSQIRTFWGLTVRRDDNRKLLMGKALLKPHQMNSEVFDYAGYYCDDNWSPLENERVIEDFKRAFCISRNIQPGLTIVVPYPVREISRTGMMRSTILNYFYAILAGLLEIELGENDSDSVILNRENLIDEIHSINWNGTDWENIDVREVMSFVRSAIDRSELIELNSGDTSTFEINGNSFPDIETLREKFRQGDTCHFRLPVKIQSMEQGTTGLDTYISIHIRKFPALKGPMEFYVRSGILVTEIKTLGSRPILALLVAEDEPVARFLGDCETPAHTNWNERTEGFKEKYENAVRLLRFIKKCISRTVSVLDEPPRERQVEFLKDIFSIPIQEEEEERRRERPEHAPEDIERKVPLFNVTQMPGGFRVHLNPQRRNISFPFQATIKMAYDTRRGNPFAQYEKFDFDVSKDPITITEKECKILKKENNSIEIKVEGPNFELTVKGFNLERDLVLFAGEA